MADKGPRMVPNVAVWTPGVGWFAEACWTL